MFRVESSEVRTKNEGVRFEGLRFTVQGAGSRVQGLGFRVWRSEHRFQGVGFTREYDSGFRSWAQDSD